MTDPGFLRTAEVARRLHVSSKTVARWARDGLLPFVSTLGGHRRYPEQAIAALELRLSEGLDLAVELAAPVEEAS